MFSGWLHALIKRLRVDQARHSLDTSVVICLGERAKRPTHDQRQSHARQRHVPIFVGTENESRDFDGTRLETFRDTKRVVVVVALSPIDVFGRQRRVDHVGW